MRLVVLVSGRGSNLAALWKAIDEGRCSAEVVAVVADRDAPALEQASSRGVATAIVPLRRGDDREAWNVALKECVEAHRPDLVVLAGFMRVLGGAFVQRYRSRIVNVHPALLPSFPGAHGPADAIAAGVRLSGCTVHLVDEGVDTGPILAQAAVRVLPGDDAASLHARIQRAEHALLPAVVHAVATGALELDGPTWRTHGDDDGVILFGPDLPSG
ncbi:MAG: phosphoribosylglycinamide formyltransferase [Sandaracinus sp.]|nr:phosphoribosylglycinamide formyltransferase [Sandaracinus sp.]